jgi:hypothetical protein
MAINLHNDVFDAQGFLSLSGKSEAFKGAIFHSRLSFCWDDLLILHIRGIL